MKVGEPVGFELSKNHERLGPSQGNRRDVDLFELRTNLRELRAVINGTRGEKKRKGGKMDN